MAHRDADGEQMTLISMIAGPAPKVESQADFHCLRIETQDGWVSVVASSANDWSALMAQLGAVVDAHRQQQADAPQEDAA